MVWLMESFDSLHKGQRGRCDGCFLDWEYLCWLYLFGRESYRTLKRKIFNGVFVCVYLEISSPAKFQVRSCHWRWE